MFVASATVKEGGKIVPLAENIFGAVYQFIGKVRRYYVGTTDEYV